MTKVNNMKWIAAMIGCGMIGSFTGDIARSFADNSQATSNILSDGVVIPYDGYLMLDSAPVNAQGQELEFALYESPSGGVAQWVETQTVNVVNGRFSVALGKGTKLSASPANATFSDVILDAQRLYIGIKVKDSGGQFIELAGRQAIEAAPFAAWSARSADFKVEGVLQPQNGIVMRDDTSISGVDQIVGYNDLRLSGSSTSGESNLLINGMGHVNISKDLSVSGVTTVSGLTVNSHATLQDGLTVQDTLTAHDTLDVKGADLSLGTTSNARGDGGRALVKYTGDTLHVNFNGDFAGGTQVDSSLVVDGNLTVNGGLQSWPAGSYCVLRSGGSCPSGFTGGRLVTYGNALPDNSSQGDSVTSSDAGGEYLELQFCCK